VQDIFPQTAARLARWTTQREVLGVILVGSKSRDYRDDLSDDDLEVFLTDEAFERLAPADCHEFAVEGEGETRKLIFDALYTTLDDLRRKVSSTHDLDHWPYERARVLFDREGDVSRAVEAAGSMGAEFRRARLLHATVDTWIATRRAAKTLRRGMEGGGRMVVARGAKALSRVIFALEWRWVPLDHWLEAEIRTLDDPAGAGEKLIEALTSGRPEPLEEALERLEDQLFAEGVPRAAERRALFLELLHPSRAEERAVHGLP
jgi:hypothetical protein